MKLENEIKMGQMPKLWNGGKAKEITFCVTEDCNLVCNYCYMTGKNKKNRMSFDVAKKAVDYILNNREYFKDEAVVWAFVGGEPFLEIDLIDQISDYIKQQMYILDHPWFNKYMFSFSSNGLLYSTPEVQNYIRKNKNHISIGISIDGNKIKHDLQRVKPDGTGSYDDVVKNVQLWQKQFSESSTKSTFAHEDLPYLKDSIISLWDLGIKNVAANVVFEDVWNEGDDAILENQLKKLADYILEKELWKEYSVRFFSPDIGFPLIEEDLKQNYCGSGKMLAIDCNGNFLPCIRFLDFSLNKRKGYTVGDIYNGIDEDRLRPFMALTLESQSKEECLQCDVATGCAWCTGFNYDAADTDTIYQRINFNCKMHKATVRANEYFWQKFSRVTGLVSPREEHMNSRKMQHKYLLFITSDEITPHCSYRNWKQTKNYMSKELLDVGLQYAKKNRFTPVFLGKPLNTSEKGQHEGYYIVNGSEPNLNSNNLIIVYDNDISDKQSVSDNSILLIRKDNIHKICSLVETLFNTINRINIVLEDIEKWKEHHVTLYKEELSKLVSLIYKMYKENQPVEINVLTDILNSQQMKNCDAGNSTFSLAPNGKIYICPAFYFYNPDNYIGTLETGIKIKNSQLFELEKAPICSSCDAYHCRRCKALNKKLTSEYNTPSKIQCLISHIEREKSRELQIILEENTKIRFRNSLKEIDYADPLEKLVRKKGRITNA